MDLLESLNESQRAAVTYCDGPSLVIAGAGSGKTRVLTYKIAYLLQQGMRAYNILALTFTNKAAREMKERIMQLVPPESARYLWMGTFHSICAKILRQEAQKLGYTRDFSIYDTTDSRSLLKQIIKQHNLDEKVYKPNIVHAKISAAKNVLESAEAYAMNQNHTKQDRFDRLYEMAEIYRLYEMRLKAANAMDFDDLLVNICKLFRQDPDTLHHYQEIFQYVLVDEYQDTNYAQYLIVKQLAEPQNKICVVGDDAQSIYSFRGADIRNILTFRNGYADAKMFKLERNYRSTQTIVQAANSLIHHNEHQIYKEVYSEKVVGDKLQIIPYMSDRDEATGVAESVKLDKLRKLSDGTSVTYDDIAILYRTNSQSRAFENELRRLNIPYRIYGGMSFYQRKEIKDAIGYFRLIANPMDNEALIRVINFPARGIGDTTLKKISEQSILKDLSMFEVVSDPDAAELPVSASLKNKLIAFGKLITGLQDAMETKDAYEFAEMVFQQSNLMGAAMADKTPEGIDRKENLEELISGIREFVDGRINEGIAFTPIQDFLAEVSLLTDQDEHLDDHTARVTLMTVHAAKGLEFPIVYIVGMEENLFPSQYCNSPQEMEEERRLLYVAITRSMEQCRLTFARQRFKNGSLNFSSPSKFLSEIDRQFVQVTSASQPRPQQPRWQNMTWGSSSPSTKPQTPAATPTPARHLTQVSASKASPLESEWKAADRVSHRVFGNGTVVRVYTENGNDKIDINFDTAGKKTLLLTFAKLVKI